jgi:hypothetical protein
MSDKTNPVRRALPARPPRSPVRQFRTPGSARGASSNRRPYLNRQNYATNRASVEYAMVDLKPLSGRKPSSD